MATVTAKSLRVFSAVEALREGHADVRQALLPLFRPDLSRYDGEVYDPSKIAAEINKSYKLNVTRDIIIEFTPLFLAQGWLRPIPTADDLAYIVTCPNDEEVLSSNKEFETRAAEVGHAFRSFIEQLSPLSAVHRSDAELVDALVDWLLSIDVYSEDELRTVRKVSQVGRKLVYETVTVDNQRATDENYLCARFVDSLIESESPLFPFLIELGSVGLITDVVRDFQKPLTGVQKTDLAVYLDAPVALDFLGLSGSAAQENIRLILQRVVSIGGTLRIFRVSVEEMQNSLGALLARPAPERDGPTAQALRRREVYEPFVRQVANNPDRILQETGIAIVDQPEDAFPNEHKFFSSKDIQDLYAAVHWVKDDRPRYHDALAAGLVLRKRGATRSNDVFETKHVMITQNPYFPPVARRGAMEKHYLGPSHVGPVVHQRHLATAVWLRAGLGTNDQEVPRRYILSACRRVLTIHKNIIDRVRHEARNLSEVKKEQLELLLTEGRSTQVLMDKTLGSANVIDSSNIERLVEEMRRSVASEVIEEAERKVEEIQRRADEERREHEGSLAAADDHSKSLEGRLAEESKRVRRVANSILEQVNRHIRRRRRILAIGGFFTVVAVEGAPLLMGDAVGVVITGTLLVVTLALHYIGVLRTRIFEPIIARLDRRALEKRISSAGLMGDLPFDIQYADGQFLPLEPASIIE